MSESQEEALKREDSRFYAISATEDSIRGIATTERLTDGCVVGFALPSGPALSLSLARSAHLRRVGIDVSSLFDEHPHPQGTWPENHTPLFDYFELAITEVVFSYAAIEGALNELIPESATYSRKSKPGRPPQILRGAEIERKLSLDEKIKRALPTILKIASPAGSALWTDYSQLQDIRDRLIHLKSNDRRASGCEDETIWGRLLRSGQRSYPDIAYRIIAHFYPTNRRWFSLFGVGLST